jgi:hypothetical protein
MVSIEPGDLRAAQDRDARGIDRPGELSHDNG